MDNMRKQFDLGGPLPPEAAALEKALNTLPDRDQDFAQSLLASARGRGLSAKQVIWCSRLVQKAKEAASPDMLDFGGVSDMLFRAGTRLKFPKLLLDAGDDLGPLRLTIAGDTARVPGSVNVAQAKGDKLWLGRILRSGAMEWNMRIEADRRASALSALRAFAANPSQAAMAYGRRLGCCCLCGRTLADPVSVAHGVGPICSEKWGLEMVRIAVADAIADGRIT